MKSLFKTIPLNQGNIIKNEKALLSGFLPTNYFSRQSELTTIANAINPLFKNLNCDNLLITGPIGTGKTSSIKFMINELEKETARVIPVYVNCWEYPTQMGVYSKILNTLRIPLPRRGLAGDEVLSRITEKMQKEKFSILVVLDGIKSLVVRKQYKVLYNLAKANDLPGVSFGVIGIANDSDVLKEVDEQTRSSIRFSHLKYNIYDVDVLLKILKERAQLALMVGSYTDEELKLCALVGKKHKSNARLALTLLWKAAKHAEARGSKKIEKQDIDAVTVNETLNSKVEEQIEETPFNRMDEMRLTEEENIILEILKKNGELESTKVYREFLKKRQKTKRQIRNYLKILEAKGLIEIKIIDDSQWMSSMLKPRIISLRKQEGSYATAC